MMGPTHVLSAGVAWLAVAAPLSHHVHPLTPATTVLGTVVAAGAGLFPDLDHHNGTIARTFGPVSRGICRAVAAVSGGHRRATHSLAGTAVATGLAFAATRSVWTVTLLLWLCIGVAARSLWQPAKRRRNGRLDSGDITGVIHAGIAAGVAYWVARSGVDAGVVPWAVAVGYVTHLAGDSMTAMGVPWLWPNPRRYRIASIDTGKSVEKRLVVPALYVALGVVAYSTRGQWAPALIPSD